VDPAVDRARPELGGDAVDEAARHERDEREDHQGAQGELRAEDALLQLAAHDHELVADEAHEAERQEAAEAEERGVVPGEERGVR